MLVLLALALPMSASADSVEVGGLSYGLSANEPSGTLLIEAQGIARAYWGRDPECGPTWGTLLPPTSVGGSPSDERHGITVGCRAWVDARPTYFPDAFCRTVVHEFGHLLGYEHGESQAGDPLNVMSETLQPFAPCEQMADAPEPVTQRTRSVRRPSDRKWCRRHAIKCVATYRHLARRALSAQAFAGAVVQSPNP